MSSRRRMARRGMSIRAHLIWVLTGMLICGLGITSYFSWIFIGLERMQYNVSSQSLALRELHSIEEQLDLLLVSSDLAIGSGETYTAQIAYSLANDLAHQATEIGVDASLPYDQNLLVQFENKLDTLAEQIKVHEKFRSEGHDADRSDLLARFDSTSQDIVRIFEKLSDTARSFADQSSMTLESSRARSTLQYALALVLYLFLSAAIIFTTIKRIAWPLEDLTRNVDNAMKAKSDFTAMRKGPREMVRLARHFARLVTQLEEKVAARTRELVRKTSSLEQEVTERKAIQVKLEKAKESAEKSSRVKSEFLSVMSHELRTPMNAVLGSLSLIRDSGITEEQKGYVDIADESGTALVGLLGDILDLSKIEAEEFEFKNEPFSVCDVVCTTVNMLQRSVDEKGLRMSATIDPDVPSQLIGDFNRVRQILINLVNNAIKFTEKGFVEIHISMAQGGSIPGNVRFSVRDSGIGIERSVRHEIFNTFTQVDSSLAREHSGVGLGLSICSKLAHAMGGKCGVESEPGHGSNFWFTIALPVFEVEPEDESDLFSMSGFPSPLLLVKNDDEFAADWASGVLQKNALSFTEATNLGQAKIAWADAVEAGNPYACVIVPIGDSGSIAVEEFKQLAACVHDHQGRLIVLSTAVDSKISRWIKEGLVDDWHCGTACQQHLLKRIGTGDRAGMAQNFAASTPEWTGSLKKTGSKILIVEDSRANRLIASAILKNAGFEVEEAGSGPEAIHLVQGTDFDLVLMDLQMSEMDGFETTKAIRGLSTDSSKMPIIAFSANVMEETRSQCTEVGMNDFVSKPFVKEALLDTIARWT